MGMSVGGGQGGPVSEPNIVPLIDVLLVLIIIFMVITPKTPTGLDALVPQPPPPNQKQQPDDNKTIVVQVAPNGKLKINQDFKPIVIGGFPTLSLEQVVEKFGPFDYSNADAVIDVCIKLLNNEKKNQGNGHD